MKIGFFGKIGQAFGGEAEVSVPSEGMTVDALRCVLAESFETDAILNPGVRAMVNDVVASESQIVTACDRVEFLSPLSGG